MEGNTNFSKRLKEFDGLTWLTPTPPPYFMTDVRHCLGPLHPSAAVSVGEFPHSITRKHSNNETDQPTGHVQWSMTMTPRFMAGGRLYVSNPWPIRIKPNVNIAQPASAMTSYFTSRRLATPNKCSSVGLASARYITDTVGGNRSPKMGLDSHFDEEWSVTEIYRHSLINIL